MSVWSDFLWTPQFVTGSFVSGVLASGITFFSTRASDRRKFKQEKAMQARKEERDDKLRDDESLYNVAMEFAEVCTDILMNSVDIKGAFNLIRDLVFTQAGANDPKAEDKIDHAMRVSEESKRITKPYNKLRMIAPKNVIEAAVNVNAAMLAVLRTTPEPFARPITYKVAADAIENFINVFRAEVGKDAYTASDAQNQTMSFLANLKKQVHDYVEESKAEMNAAGFKTTPWDNLGGPEKPGR
jgi:hypothetical protein